MSLSERGISINVFPIETQRAFWNSNEIAWKQNTNIGIQQFFNGIFQEMGKLAVATCLQRHGVGEKEFYENIELVKSSESVVKVGFDDDPRLTPLVSDAIRLAGERASEKSTPEELLPSDLLLSLATIAKFESLEIRALREFARVTYRVSDDGKSVESVETPKNPNRNTITKRVALVNSTLGRSLLGIK